MWEQSTRPDHLWMSLARLAWPVAVEKWQKGFCELSAPLGPYSNRVVRQQDRYHMSVTVTKQNNQEVPKQVSACEGAPQREREGGRRRTYGEGGKGGWIDRPST
jgi:hypothetical protein